MSKTILKTGAALAVTAALTGVANAGSLSVSSQAVGVEASTRSAGTTVKTTGAFPIYRPGTDLGDQDVITFTVTNGEFATGPYKLLATRNLTSRAVPANLLNATSNQAGGTTVSFRLTAAFSPSISGGLVIASTANNAIASAIAENAVPFVIKNVSAGGNAATLSAKTTNSTGALNIDTAAAAELAQGFNEFSASVSAASGTSKTVNVASARKLFLDGTSKALFGIHFTQTSGAVGSDTVGNDGVRDVLLTSADTVQFTLSGDMSGIASIVGSKSNQKAIIVGNTATLTVDADDLFSGTSTTYPITINVDESTALEARTIKAAVDFKFADEIDKNVVAETTVSTWSVNGTTAKIPHLSLAVNNFRSWLKIANTGSVAADIEVSGTYTLADGTSASVGKKLVKSVAGNSVTTVSEEEMIAALNLDSTQLIDVSLVVDVAAEADNIQILAEKKSGDTRQVIPVLYDASTSGSRKYFQ